MNYITVFYDHIRNASLQSGLSVEELAARLINAGVSGVEIEYQELLGPEGAALFRRLSSLALPVKSVYCKFHWENEASGADYREVLQHLNELGIHNLLVIPGFTAEKEYMPPTKGQNISEAHLSLMKKFLPKLTALCREAARYKIQILMEDFDFYKAPFGTREELKWFLERVPGLGCAFDTGNFLYFDEDSLEVLPDLLKYIRYVHCKDRSLVAVEGEEPLTTVSGKKLYSSPVGKGMIRMTEIIDMILKSGYEGNFAIEHFGALDQLRYISESAEYLSKRLLANGD